MAGERVFFNTGFSYTAFGFHYLMGLAVAKFIFIIHSYYLIAIAAPIVRKGRN